jgi:hypothetical protein
LDKKLEWQQKLPIKHRLPTNIGNEGLQKVLVGAVFKLFLVLSGRYIYKDRPSRRQHNFGLRWGDHAVEHCLSEHFDFASNGTIPSFIEKTITL